MDQPRRRLSPGVAVSESQHPTEFPNAIEQRVVDMLLQGEFAPFPALRAQWSRARVRERRHREYGTVTTFWLPPWEVAIPPLDQMHHDVHFLLEGKADYCGVMLQVDDGLIETLEYDATAADLAAGLPIEEISYTTHFHITDEEDDWIEVSVPVREWDRIREWLAMHGIGGDPAAGR
jgi:hypothetical protein